MSDDDENEYTEWQQQMIAQMGRNIDVLQAYPKFGMVFPLLTDDYFEALSRLSWLGMYLMPIAIRDFKLSLQLPEIFPIFENGEYWVKINPKE
jgi:hypothetical protein